MPNNPTASNLSNSAYTTKKMLTAHSSHAWLGPNVVQLCMQAQPMDLCTPINSLQILLMTTRNYVRLFKFIKKNLCFRQKKTDVHIFGGFI